MVNSCVRSLRRISMVGNRIRKSIGQPLSGSVSRSYAQRLSASWLYVVGLPSSHHVSQYPSLLSSARPNLLACDGFNRRSFSRSDSLDSAFRIDDKETEIAVLAEIEREIYVGMEMLEDAFEALHRKAEMVRRSMRERGAGLSVSLQSRRTSYPDIMTSSTPGLPSAGLGPSYKRPAWTDGGSEVAQDREWDDDDMQSELAPDDSASKIHVSSSKHKRPKRRNERRTPALVEEDEG